MVSRSVLAVAVLAAAVTASATAGSGWRLVSLEKRSGAIGATVTYQSRRDPTTGDTVYRRVRLVLRRGGAVVLDRTYTGVVAATPTLALRNVWGDRTPEAEVETFTGGNLCCTRLEVGLIAANGEGAVLFHDFPTYGWHSRRHRKTVDFVSSDWGFICAFTSCADGSAPIQVLAIDPQGRQFADVTRSRPGLVAADAASQWRRYLRERGNVGLLAAWCADEYLLGSKARCDRTLSAESAAGRLDDASFAVRLHRSLKAWGYVS